MNENKAEVFLFLENFKTQAQKTNLYRIRKSLAGKPSPFGHSGIQSDKKIRPPISFSSTRAKQQLIVSARDAKK